MNKNKLGFTLAELLAVITILGVIALIVFPAVNKAIKNSKEKSYNQQVDSILNSAENWTTENMSQLSDTSNNYITIGELQQSGYLEAKRVINPITDEEMNGCIVIKYDTNYSQYTYNYNETSCDELKPKIYTFQEVMEKSADVMNNDPVGNLRYVGATPDNYVKFNNELWRVIGVFDGQTKIIRNDYLESNGITQIQFDTNETNDWATSSLQLALNNTTNGYITLIQTNDPTSYSYINVNHVWNLGAYDSSFRTTGTRSVFYTAERGTTVYSGRPTTWTGAIGLMYVSDYGYSTSGDETTCDTTNLYNWSENRDSLAFTECTVNSWLYGSQSQSEEWTITPESDRSNLVFRVSGSGYITDNGYAGVYDCVMVRPVLFLKPEVKIVGGKGTEQEPYELGM